MNRTQKGKKGKYFHSSLLRNPPRQDPTKYQDVGLTCKRASVETNKLLGCRCPRTWTASFLSLKLKNIGPQTQRQICVNELLATRPLSQEQGAGTALHTARGELPWSHDVAYPECTPKQQKSNEDACKSLCAWSPAAVCTSITFSHSPSQPWQLPRNF